MGSSAIGLLGILYVAVAGNYVGDLLSCDMQRFLTRSVISKHLIILLGALFWVAEVTDANGEAFATVIGRAIAIYGLFVVSTKSEWWALVPVLMLLIADQILRVFQSKREVTSDIDAHTPRELAGQHGTDWVVCTRTGVQIACVAILLVGFAAYAARQARDHGGAFDLATFVLGTAKCRGV